MAVDSHSSVSEKYREMFPEYDQVFINALSSAVSSCGLQFLLRKEQIQALNYYLKGRDVVVNLPTGYGKSLCYALCPLVFDNLRGVTSKEQRSILVLISPLKALMDDQIFSLSQLGLSCLKLTPDIIIWRNHRQTSRRWFSGRHPFAGVIWVCCREDCTSVSEGVDSQRSHRRIDEAHCIEQWSVLFN